MKGIKINKKRFLAITSIILFILLFSSILIYYVQKNNKKPISISDCEKIKDTIKKQECLIEVAEGISSYNIKKAIDLCNKIEDDTIIDICFFQIVQTVDFYDIDIIRRNITCEIVNNSIWREYCNRVMSHPHLAMR